MEILINKPQLKQSAKVEYAHLVTDFLAHKHEPGIKHLEIINLYDKASYPVMNEMDSNSNKFLPFLFVVNNN